MNSLQVRLVRREFHKSHPEVRSKRLEQKRKAQILERKNRLKSRRIERIRARFEAPESEYPLHGPSPLVAAATPENSVGQEGGPNNQGTTAESAPPQ